MQVVRVWSSVWRNAITKTVRRNYGGGNLRPPTMNEMPVPEGDFFALNAKRQGRQNAILAAGICSLGFGLTLLNVTDIEKFHFSPPTTYE